MSKTKHNPAGYPLSGEPEKGRVSYRPRVGGQRPRLQVPEEVASRLEDDAVNATDRRRQLAYAAAGEEKERRAKKPPKEPKPRKPRAKKPPKEPKPRKPRAKKPPKEPKPRKPRAKKPPKSIAQVAQVLDVAPSTAAAIVSCAVEKVAKKKARKTETGQVDLFAKNPPLKRGPCSLADLQVVTFLGYVAELAYDTSDGYRQRLKKPAKPIPLYWAPEARAAIFVNGETRRSKATKGVRDGAARRVYKAWTGRQADDAYTITIPRGAAAKWRKLGRGFTITYRSERSQEPAEHDLGRTVSVYTFGTLWVVHGRDLRCGKHGLEG